MSKIKSSGNIEVSKESKIKLNVDFVLFVSKVIKEKLLVSGKENLRKVYLENVNVKSYNNIERVSNRSKREKLRSVLNEVLKENGLSFEEYKNVSDKLVEKIKEKKVSNYIEV